MSSYAVPFPEKATFLPISSPPADPVEVLRQEEFVRLFVAAYHPLYSYLVALVSNRADADDLMQEAGLLLWRKFDEFQPLSDEPVDDFVRWARGFARNLARNFHRVGKGRQRPFDDELLAKLAVTRLEAEELLELRRDALRLCVEKLSPADREFLRICYSEHRTVAAAARELARPSNAVYKKLRRLHRALFECIRRNLDL